MPPRSAVLNAGVRVEVSRQHVRFHGGAHDGLHRWPDYALFIEPSLKPWERARVYELWAASVGMADRGARRDEPGRDSTPAYASIRAG